MSSLSLLSVGTTLQGGKYRLDALLSQGGFGVTYRATHTLLHQPVVLKTLNLQQEPPKRIHDLGERFIQEAQRLAQFNHPHIVRVSDCFIEGGRPFIVMDYIPGRTLAQVIQEEGPLPEKTALHYIRQVASALELVHEHGLLHRDVKPDNIMLRDGTDQVVLIDFGIAREYTAGVTETNTGLLSAGYAPVEQYLPRHQWTPATDVYALAATLYALLAGRPPVASVLRDRVPLEDLRQFQPNLSQRTIDAIEAGMALDVRERPQTVQAWLQLLMGQPVARQTTATVAVMPQYRSTILANTQPEGTAVVAPPKQRNFSPWLWLLGTAIFGSLAGIGLGLFLRNQPVDTVTPRPPRPQEQEFPPTLPTIVPPVEVTPTPTPTPTPEPEPTPTEPTPTPEPTETPTPSPSPEETSPEPTPTPPPSLSPKPPNSPKPPKNAEPPVAPPTAVEPSPPTPTPSPPPTEAMPEVSPPPTSNTEPATP
ncbi:serine/threonine-protein kinase [Thermosynechococcus sp. JY1334]|uniref:serine/threonine-protein kinase n=1 Tax=unclassified Thermosynechococcus TaxID=2622553 RepID=UPI002671C312|nr:MULTISPECIES: serine/threonine-protein kinase [unclassified Thermosynechococcus]MDR7898117.1 serine/threonine-protein kinase [Thermosynechococcus sp. JY1332]MDR7905518.1 serine/threonine-protein kinase [Thermosynechococcus sp. JY1334]WKT85248.1 serine/threonine-protein kinase [Thermosynechococcus sp. JY1339]WNC54191.1 serine/threonine-protein kinase [Thermosynechococcus sp. JY1331]